MNYERNYESLKSKDLKYRNTQFIYQSIRWKKVNVFKSECISNSKISNVDQIAFRLVRLMFFQINIKSNVETNLE